MSAHEFVHTVWPYGIVAVMVLGFTGGVVLWLADPDADADRTFAYLFGGPCIGMIVGSAWPAWPLAVPAYGLWRLRRRLHRQLRIPVRDLRSVDR